MTLGQRLITELARRRQTGMFFDYRGYRVLRKVDSQESLRRFLDERGLEAVGVCEDPATIADDLAALRGQRQRKWVLGGSGLRWYDLILCIAIPEIWIPWITSRTVWKASRASRPKGSSPEGEQPPKPD